MNKTVFITQIKGIYATEDTESTEISRTNNTSVCDQLIILRPSGLSSVLSVFSASLRLPSLGQTFVFSHPRSALALVFSVVKKYLAGFLSGLACLTFFPPLRAADPLVVLPSGDFSCEVKVTPHDSPKKEPADPDRPASELKKIAIVQVGDVRLDEMTWTDGNVSQIWTLLTGNLSFQANKNKSLKSNLSIEANKNKSLYALTASMRDNIRTKLLDFTPDSISWISPKTLTNGGKEGAPPPPILHYQKTIPLDPELENSNLDGSVAPVKTIIIQAWIDSKTLRPLKFDNGHALYTLTFADQTPTTIPPMPETVQAEFKKWIATSGPARHR